MTSQVPELPSPVPWPITIFCGPYFEVLLPADRKHHSHCIASTSLVNHMGTSTRQQLP